MIIDDFESFRSSMRLMLSSFGAVQIELASSADEALQKCLYEYFDVILCDFNLGPDKNGQQILEELRIKKRLKHSHLFIMITAETSKEVVLSTREYQPDAYIAKPVTRAVLERRLAQLLSQQKALKAINRELDLGNHTKAITLCQQKIEAGSRYRSWCTQTLAQLYIKVGDIANAEKIYTDILKSRDIPWAKMGMGTIRNLEQRHAEAIVYFDEVISAHPNLLEAYDGAMESHLKLGQTIAAQRILEQAVELAPSLVGRQENLGKICIQNNDLETASIAFKRAIGFSENTIHKKVDHYLDLGRCLSDLSFNNHTDRGKTYANEGLEVLEKVESNFSEDAQANINALLIEARIEKGQDQDEQSFESLSRAENLIGNEDPDATIGLEYAKTLYAFERDSEALNLLIRLSNRYAGNKEILARIESLIDEPQDLQTRIRAKDLNKEAISLVNQGNLALALEKFKEAIALTPRHTALNLNYVQVVMKFHEESGDRTCLVDADHALQQLEHIPTQHHQHKRYRHFKSQIQHLLEAQEKLS